MYDFIDILRACATPLSIIIAAAILGIAIRN